MSRLALKQSWFFFYFFVKFVFYFILSSVCGISVVNQRTSIRSILYRIRVAQILSFHIFFFPSPIRAIVKVVKLVKKSRPWLAMHNIYEWPAVYVHCAPVCDYFHLFSRLSDSLEKSILRVS